MQTPFPSFIIHRAPDGSWAWQFAVAEGVAIATSTTTYRTQQECAQAIQMVRGATNVATFGSLDDLEGLASSMRGPGSPLTDLGDSIVIKAEPVSKK